MKIPLSYGAGMAVGGMILTLIQYLLGYHSSLEKFQSGQLIGQIGGPLVSIVGLVLAMRAVRSHAADGSLSYGRAVGTGALAGLFSGLFSAVFMFIYGTFINPDFHEILYQFATRNMTSEQADAAGRFIRVTTGVTASAVMAVIFSPIFCTIFSLVIAIFMKRAPQTPPLPPVATV